MIGINQRIRNLNNQTAVLVGKIQASIFGAIAIVDKILSEIVYPLLEQLVPENSPAIFTVMLHIFKVVTVIFIDVVIYKKMSSYFEKKYDRELIKKDKSRDIGGKWYHVHIPYLIGHVDYSRNLLSAGETIISRDFADYTFSSENHYYGINNNGDVVADKSARTTHWYTKTAKFSDDNDCDLIEVYRVNASAAPKFKLSKCPCCERNFEFPIEIQEADCSRLGIHRYFLRTNEEGVCNKIYAEYSDCWPSFKSGQLYLFRTAEERNAKIKEYFAEARERNLVKC